MQRKTIPGHFTRIDGSNHIGISEEEARRLSAGHCRDVDEHIASMKRNPFARLKAEGCQLVYEVHRAPVATVPQGGPSIAADAPARDQLQFMLDLVADHDPVSYDRAWDRVNDPEGPAPEEDAAALMELLDNVAGPDITFTVRGHEVAGETHLKLGFWPTEETSNGEAPLA